MYGAKSPRNVHAGVYNIRPDTVQRLRISGIASKYADVCHA